MKTNQEDLQFDICKNNHGGNAESTAAHKSIVRSKVRYLTKILDALAEAGAKGHTVDELTQLLNARHQNISARCSELKKRKQIKTSGETRKTSSGRSAAVLILNNTEGL